MRACIHHPLVPIRLRVLQRVCTDYMMSPFLSYSKLLVLLVQFMADCDMYIHDGAILAYNNIARPISPLVSEKMQSQRKLPVNLTLG